MARACDVATAIEQTTLHLLLIEQENEFELKLQSRACETLPDGQESNMPKEMT